MKAPIALLYALITASNLAAWWLVLDALVADHSQGHAALVQAAP